MGKTLIGLKGLKKLANQVSGSENIAIGIRPYGFHAGNELTMYTYPWILCKMLKGMGKEPRFNFFICLNDIEPRRLKYLYFEKEKGYFYKNEELIFTEEVPFEYNIFPRDTSFQYTPDTEGCCASMTDHWQKIIESKITRLKKDFPRINFTFIRASFMKNSPYYKQAIRFSLEKPEAFGKIVDKYEKVCFEKGFLSWSGAICPKCHTAQGKTKLSGEKVSFECEQCKKKYSKKIDELSFWMHHLFIVPARLKMFGIDIFFRGYDHYSCKHIEMTEKLYEKLFKEKLAVKTIVPPLIVGSDGKKMGKTWANEKTIDSELLKELALSCNDEKIILK